MNLRAVLGRYIELLKGKRLPDMRQMATSNARAALESSQLVAFQNVLDKLPPNHPQADVLRRTIEKLRAAGQTYTPMSTARDLAMDYGKEWGKVQGTRLGTGAAAAGAGYGIYQGAQDPEWHERLRGAVARSRVGKLMESFGIHT